MRIRLLPGLIALLLLLSSCIDALPTQQSPAPVQTATPEPAPTATPELTATATPELTPTASPASTATPTPEPTATPTPEPTPTPTPAPTPWLMEPWPDAYAALRTLDLNAREMFSLAVLAHAFDATNRGDTTMLDLATPIALDAQGEPRAAQWMLAGVNRVSWVKEGRISGDVYCSYIGDGGGLFEETGSYILQIDEHGAAQITALWFRGKAGESSYQRGAQLKASAWSTAAIGGADFLPYLGYEAAPPRAVGATLYQDPDGRFQLLAGAGRALIKSTGGFTLVPSEDGESPLHILKLPASGGGESAIATALWAIDADFGEQSYAADLLAGQEATYVDGQLQGAMAKGFPTENFMQGFYVTSSKNDYFIYGALHKDDFARDPAVLTRVLDTFVLTP